MERYFARRDDPKASTDVAGSPDWPIFLSPDDVHPYYWTYGLCEQARLPAKETATAGVRPGNAPLLSYVEDVVQKGACECKKKEQGCEFVPWEQEGIPQLSYFFNYKDGCEVDEDSICLFKAVAQRPKKKDLNSHNNEKLYYSFEPCAEWKGGSNNEVVESLVTFCAFYKLLTVIGFVVCAAVHAYGVIVGFIFLKNSCADPVGTTFTSFDTWADEKLDYDADAWSDPWTDSD